MSLETRRALTAKSENKHLHDSAEMLQAEEGGQDPLRDSDQGSVHGVMEK